MYLLNHNALPINSIMDNTRTLPNPQIDLHFVVTAEQVFQKSGYTLNSEWNI